MFSILERYGYFIYEMIRMEYSKTEKIMGTDVTLTIFWEKHNGEDIERVFGLFCILEEEFSRFKAESILSQLNTKRSLGVSDKFIDVLSKCKDIYSDTDFYFNPLINLNQLGYSKDFHSKEFKKEELETRANLDLEAIKIIGNKVALQEWQYLDLGGIVKWYAVDAAKEYLNEKWYNNYIIDAGGDIFTAGVNEQWGKIVVGIDSPFIPWNIFATIEVENTAIATSGNYRRKWKIEDQEYNHIINPLTWANNNEIVSITLITKNCYLGDAYATACIAMWVEKTLAFLKKNHLDGVIICADKKVYTLGMEKYNLQII